MIRHLRFLFFISLSTFLSLWCSFYFITPPGVVRIFPQIVSQDEHTSSLDSHLIPNASKEPTLVTKLPLESAQINSNEIIPPNPVPASLETRPVESASPSTIIETAKNDKPDTVIIQSVSPSPQTIPEDKKTDLTKSIDSANQNSLNPNNSAIKDFISKVGINKPFYDWLAIAILMCFLAAIPRIPGLRISYSHLWPFKKLVIAPPAWLGVIGGWILGVFVGFLNFHGSIADLIVLALPIFIFILKNWHPIAKKSNPETNETESILQRLNKLYKNRQAIDFQEIASFYAALKVWFCQETAAVSDSTDLTFAKDKAKKIANQLTEIIEQNNAGLRIGIVGSFGCGKSSIINLTLHYLGQKKICGAKPIICKISMWGCHSSASAQEYILEALLKETASHFDSSSFAPITEEWNNLTEGSGSGKLKMLKFLWAPQTFSQRLEELSILLKKLNYHLILVIEDIDRNDDREYCPKQIQALLERLKGRKEDGGLDCSIIIAGQRTSIDFSRLCESLVSPPVIPAYTLKEIIWAIARYHLPQAFNNWRYPDQIEWSLLYGTNTSKNSLGSAAAHIDIFSLLDFQLLIGNPRTFKAFLRRLDDGWNRLQGEIDYFDFFLITLLRTALPDSFDFIHSHHEILRTIRKRMEVSSNSKKSLNGDLANLKSKFKDHREELEDRALSFDKIISLLFGEGVYEKLDMSSYLNVRSWPANKSQRVAQGPFPTDYWGRAYMEDIQPNELKDKEIISAHQQWLLDPETRTGLLVMLRNELADLKWVELHLELTADQTLQLTKAILLDRSLDQHGNPVAVSFNALAEMTSRSTLMVLQALAHQQFAKFPEKFVDWTISTFEKICDNNLHVAISFVQRWIIKDEPLQAFPSKNYNLLKDKMLEFLCKKIKNSPCPSIQLMKLIPENELTTLHLYLLLLSLSEAELYSPSLNSISDFERKLDPPEWLKNSWYEAICLPETEKKALLQAVGTLFKVLSELHDIQLIEERILTVFGEHGRPTMERIAGMDFSITPLELYGAKIKDAARVWLIKHNPILVSKSQPFLNDVR
jgi:KAP family P-loop domain